MTYCGITVHIAVKTDRHFLTFVCNVEQPGLSNEQPVARVQLVSEKQNCSFAVITTGAFNN